MVLWWLYGGYVFQVVVKAAILTFIVKFDLEGKGQSPSKTIGNKTNVFSTSGYPNLNGWWVMMWTSSKLGKLGLWPYIWLWRSRSIVPQNNKELNHVVMYLWSQFGDPSLKESWVITRTNKWLTHRLTHTRTHTHTDAGNHNDRRPKLASGKNHVDSWKLSLVFWEQQIRYETKERKLAFELFIHKWMNVSAYKSHIRGKLINSFE